MNQPRIFGRWEDLPAQPRNLLETSGGFFTSWSWFEVFTKNALDPGDALRLYYVGGSSSERQAIFPTMLRAADVGAFKLRKLSSLSSYYASLYEPIADSPLSLETATAFARTLSMESPRWDAIELKPMDVQSSSFSTLIQAFGAAGFMVQTYFSFGNWYLQVNGRSSDQYFQSLPSALRNTLARKAKKFERMPGASLQIVTGGGDLPAAIDAYNKVYLASWKKPEPYPGFIPELIRMCAEKGMLRLGLIFIDGEPAAAQFWIVQDRTALIYKLAYDERFAGLSLGTILTAALMRHVIDTDGVGEIDYLTGDDSYKKDWMSHRRERWGILALNPRTIRGIAGIVRHIGGRSAKRLLRKLSNVRSPVAGSKMLLGLPSGKGL